MYNKFVVKNLKSFYKNLKSLRTNQYLKPYNRAIYCFSNQNGDQDKFSNDVMDKLKQQAKQFYDQTVAPELKSIVELEKTEQWQTEVIESPVPVVLDCYATWCQPCKKLTPILEKQAEQGQGQWKLVKLDIDKHQKIATALKIKSVPTVILISNGNAIDGFTGIPDQKKVEQFFGLLQKLIKPQDDQKQLAEQFEQLQTLANSANHKELKTMVEKFLKESLWKNHQHWLYGFLGIAQILEGDTLQCQQTLKILETKYSEEIKEDEYLNAMYRGITEELEALQNAKKEDTQLNKLLSELDNDPSNMELRLKIASYCQENQLYEEAINQLLDMMKIDKNWNNKIAHQTLLKVFEKLGSSNGLVIEGRKKMMRLLY